MFTAIITAAWRGFGLDHGNGFFEIRLGLIAFAVCKGTLWQRHKALLEEAQNLKEANNNLRLRLNQDRGFKTND